MHWTILLLCGLGSDEHRGFGGVRSGQVASQEKWTTNPTLAFDLGSFVSAPFLPTFCDGLATSQSSKTALHDHQLFSRKPSDDWPAVVHVPLAAGTRKGTLNRQRS